MLFVIKINNQSKFSKLKEDWTVLLKKSKSDTVFLTWEWMYTWWECFKDNKQLFLLTIYDETENLIGIAPLCMDKKKAGSITILRYIRFLGTMPTSSDHLDFIICQGKERETLIAIADYLLQENTWDLCLLSNMPLTSSTGKYIREIWGNKSLHLEISQVCPYISLPTRIEDFHSSLSKKMRNRITRERRNLYKKYKDIEFVIWETPNNIDDSMERLYKLHEKRWALVKHKGTFARNDVREFHKKIARKFLDSDMLRLYFLRVRGTDAATLYTFKYNNNLFYYQGGWDPEWSKDSIGSILLNLIIEDAIKKGYSEYDFLRGTELYKTQLTDKKREEVDIFIVKSLNARVYLFFRNLYHKIRGEG